MKLNTLQNDILCWAFERGEFTAGEACNKFIEKSKKCIYDSITILVKAGKLKVIGNKQKLGNGPKPKLYVCDKQPEGFSCSNYERLPVSQIKENITSLIEPTIITSHGKVIGIYTPIGEVE